MLETSCAARAALLELFLWQRKTMEIGAAFWCAVDREHRTSSKTGLAQSKWQQCVLDIGRKSAGKNQKKVDMFIDRLKKAARSERTKTLRTGTTTNDNDCCVY